MNRPTLFAAATAFALLLPAPVARADWTWPLAGEVITAYRNGDDPYAAGQHRGIDIAGEVGARVVAAAGGEVRFAGTAGSSGLTVSIRTEDGRYDTSYLHLSVTTVRKGQRVATGEVVGAVGTTGVRSTERPHLHFGVRDAGSDHAYHDPLALLPSPATVPEAPREVPSPNPAPAPLAPGPALAPLRAPAGRRIPAPRPAPKPRRAPTPRSVPRAHPAPSPHVAPTPRTAPIPRTAPSPHAAPAPERVPLPQRVPADRRVPTSRRAPTRHRVRSGRPAPAPLPAAAPLRMPAGRRVPPPPPARGLHDARGPNIAPGSSGLDLGWALACAGLLLAAGLLGLSENGRKATRSRGQRLSALLRPRLGRR